MHHVQQLRTHRARASTRTPFADPRDDIQRMVIHELRKAAAFLFLQIEPGWTARVKSWLKGEVLPKVATAAADGDVSLQIAFTAAGLRALGLTEVELRAFPLDFVEGMAGRARRLGGLAEDVAGWRFGRDDQEIHLLLAIYAPAPDDVERAAAALHTPPGLRAVHRLRAAWSEREPFGFRDGLSQPAIAGFPESEGPRTHAEDEPVSTGEFLLGYPNEHGELPISPQVRPERDPGGHLRPATPGGSGPRDLGRNGTYLVLRQLHQDVARFHAFLTEQARCVYGVDDERHRTLLAAKMMGRWPNGAPLQEGQTEEPPLRPGEENAFLFMSSSAGGCPVGAHVRRANPRDALGASGPPAGTSAGAEGALSDQQRASLRAVRRHRLIRRVVRYREGEEEGIVFIALNASIERQFEYVHRSWLHNEKIGTAFDEKDPLMSAGRGERFTIPDSPVRRCVTGLPAFVRTVGGGYFFLPGLSALRFLSDLPG